MNDVRQIIYKTIALFLVVVGLWITTLYVFACGLTLSCKQALPKVEGTSIPTLIPANLPVATQYVMPAPSPTPVYTPIVESNEEVSTDIARPSVPGGPGPAVDLTGNVDAGKQLFADNCVLCHGDEGKGDLPNPGSLDETVPPLNPIDDTLVNPDYKTFAINIDLFLEHGSVPEGPQPARNMPAWGDRGALTPQQIADLIAYVISLNQK